MYLIVGLGNPGKKYDLTRHNIGFDCIDYLGKANQIKVNKIKYKAIIGEGMIAGEKVMLVKPQTYMNLSGESVFRIVQYYNVPMDRLIVIYDDVDTDFGKIRIRKKGSAGTHNGMKNIIYMLQKDDFPRVRLGIGKSDQMPLRDFVLQRFNKEEMVVAYDMVEKAGKAVETLIASGVDQAMNAYNGTA